MDIDQWLFAKISRALKHWRKRRDEKRLAACPFKSIGLSSEYIAKLTCLFTGVLPEVKSHPGSIELAGKKLLMPLDELLMTTAQGNAALVTLSLAVLSSPGKSFFRRLRHAFRSYPALREVGKMVFSGRSALRALNPQQHAKISRLLISVDARGDAQKAANTAGQTSLPSAALHPPRKAYDIRIQTENPELLEVDRKKIEDYTLGHSFEKIDTAEEFDGVWRDIDGSDEIEEQKEALQELKLRHFIRSDDVAHATVEADGAASPGSEMPDAKMTAEFWYPEWDYRRGEYRQNHCGVTIESGSSAAPAVIHELLQATQREQKILERRITSLLQEKILKRRLSDGDSIDLDAIVERFADLKAKASPSENLYTRRSRFASDMALQILVDVSLSTDSFIAGRRIIDVAREAVFAFAGALAAHDMRFSVAGFHSHTRSHCTYVELKNFADAWQDVRRRVAGLAPIGYTRIGPALRHAGFALGNEAARRRWVILVTDARPNDYDYYEGRYGIEDVRQAVRELDRSGIHLHTLAIGNADKPSIPAMMQGASYRMLPEATRLADALADFFRRAA
ncbi:MAG: VWA domain-containing protein [Spirochaetes bacterium]|nr:VWA domain-containing protein [Spirochaetota bacterium]MBX3721211.1 VWA domain-containing protein [Turneriella sp.]